MLFKTHLVFGILIWLIIYPYLNVNKYLLLILLLLASVFPDIDKSNSKVGKRIKLISFIIEKVFGHRKLFHSLFFWGVMCGLIWHFFGGIYAIAIFIGLFSHLVIDALTKQGINFLYPVSQFRIAGFIETGSLLEVLFLILIFGAIIVTFLF